MGDSSDGSSSAAQSAQPNHIDNISNQTPHKLTAKPSGLFARLFGNNNNHQAYEQNATDLADRLPDYGRLHLNAQRVDDVAIPRTDIIGLPIDSSMADVINAFKSSGYSRLPLYNETLDDALGMVHLKDVALTYGFAGRRKTIDLKSLMRPVLFVPPSMPLGVLLQKMQAERKHMALVVDEYGGVDGLVTIEDLVEQLVGEIEDEHDTAEAAEWRKTAPNVYMCQARADLKAFEKVLGVDLASDDQDEDIDTIGGLIFMLAGRVPIRGEILPHPSGYQFEIVDADPRRIKRVRVRKSRA